MVKNTKQVVQSPMAYAVGKFLEWFTYAVIISLLAAGIKGLILLWNWIL